MPITETTHRCGICNKIYSRLNDALVCENRDIPELNKFPIGLIYEPLRSGADNCDTGGILMAIVGHSATGHNIEVECWSAVDVCMKSIDCVGHLTPMDTLNEKVRVVFQADTGIPTSASPRQGTMRFSRMIDHLVRSAIKPLLWDGEKATMFHPCPYEEKFSEYE